MATIATIAAITGTGSVYAVNAQGVQRLLKVGDALEKGETIKTVGDANVELLSEDMRPLHVNPDQTVKLDDNVFQTEQTPTAADASVTTPATTDTVIQALDRGQDLSTALDATAAGLGDGGGGGGATFVQLGRIAEGVSGNAYGFDFSGLGVNPVDVGVGQAVTTAGATGTITLNPIAGDGVISSSENGPTTVISGHVTGDAKVGDVVTIVTNGNSYTATVTAGPAGTLVFSTSVNTSDLAATGKVDASITLHNADNTSTETVKASESVVFDLVANATITLNNVAGDNIINNVEAQQANTTVSGSVTGDAKIGDTVTISVNGHNYTTTVVAGTGGALIFSRDIPTSDIVAGKNVQVSTTATDQYGNTVTVQDSHAVAVDTASATITVNTIAVDNVINNVESGQTIQVTGTVGGNAHAGDTVTLHVGEQTFTGTVGSGGTFNIPVAGSVLAGHTVTASVSGSDAAGSTYNATSTPVAVGSDNASATVKLNDIAVDNIVNNQEIKGELPVSGRVTGSVHDGDTVTITVTHGADVHTYTAVASGGQFATSVAGEILSGSTVTASVSGSDAAGSTFSASDQRVVASDNTTASVTVDPVLVTTINHYQVGETTTITGKVGGDVAAGDTVTLTNVTVGGQNPQSTVNSDGTFTITVPSSSLPHDGYIGSGGTFQPITASVTHEDAAGSIATGTYTASPVLDTTTPAITLNPIVITTQIVGETTTLPETVTVSGTAGKDAAVGDVVTLTNVSVGGQAVTTTVVDLGDGKGLGFHVDVPVSSLPATNLSPFFDGPPSSSYQPVFASIYHKDAAGSTDTEFANTTPVRDATFATIKVDDIPVKTVDGHETDGQTVAITGTVTGAVIGETVTLTNVTLQDGSHPQSTVVDLGGGTLGFKVEGVPVAQLPTNGLEDNAFTPVTASVTHTDAAGSTFTAIGSNIPQDDVVEVGVALNKIVVTSTTVDGVITDAATTTISGTVSGQAAVGDHVTLNVNGADGKPLVADVVDLGGGSLGFTVPNVPVSALPDQVSASITIKDTLGSTATDVATANPQIDSISATVKLNDIAGDNIVNNQEIKGDVTVSGTVTGAVNDGDIVTITVTHGTEVHTYPATASGGQFAITVAGEIISGSTVTASVSGSDAAGSTFSASDQRTVASDDTTASLTVNAVQVPTVNHYELGETTVITGKVGGDAAPGDTVTLTNVSVGDQNPHTTVNSDGTFTITVPSGSLPHDGYIGSGGTFLPITVSVTHEDAAHSISTGTFSVSPALDITTPGITLNPIVVTTVNGHTSEDQTVAISGTAGKDAAVGDVVTLTNVSVGGKAVTTTVIDLGDGKGLGFHVDVPVSSLPSNHEASVTASIVHTDAVGSTDTESTYRTPVYDVVEVGVALNKIVVTSTTVDGQVTDAATITLSGTVSGQAAVGDHVTLNVNDVDGKPLVADVVDLGGDKGLGFNLSNVPVSALPDTVEASITHTDKAGSYATATSNQQPAIDTTKSEITLDAVHVLTHNGSEWDGEKATVSGTVTGDATDADKVTIHLANNATQVVDLVADKDGKLHFSTTVAVADLPTDANHEFTDLKATVTHQDLAGSTDAESVVVTPAVDVVTVGIVLNPIVVTTVNHSPTEGEMTTVSGTVSGDAVLGDKVTLNFNVDGRPVVADVVDLGGGKGLGFQVDVPVISLPKDVVASLTHTSDLGSYDTVTDHTPPTVDLTTASISIDPIALATDNGYLSVETTTVTGSVDGDAAAGDVVTLTNVVIDGKHPTATVQKDLTFSIDVPLSSLPHVGIIGSGGTFTAITASVTHTDDAGSTFTAKVDATPGLDTIQTSIAIDKVTGDDNLSFAETSAGGTTTIHGTVSVVPGSDIATETITVTVNGKQTAATISQDGKTFSADVATSDLAADSNVKANLSVGDSVGSTATAEADRGYSVDTYKSGTDGNDTITGGNGNNILVGDLGSSSFVPGQKANVVLVLDTSGSMSQASVTFTNSDGSTKSETRLAAMKDSVNATLDQLHSSGAQVLVHIDQFSNSGHSVGTWDVSTTTGWTAAKAAVSALTTSNDTNYEAGLQSALGWINSTTGTKPLTGDVINKLVFVSDGQPNAYVKNISGDVEGTAVATGQSAQNAINAAVGHLAGGNGVVADTHSEVGDILAKGFDFHTVGIQVGTAITNSNGSATALGFLSELQDNANTITSGMAHATNVDNANQLASTIGTLTGAHVVADAVGNDTINGGSGNDLIFGDAMNTDKLAAQYGLTGHDPAGSGSQVFVDLENHVGTSTTWTHADTLNYILGHADELGAESGRSGGVDHINGGAGDDRIYGQEGNDFITGGAGNDTMIGGSGSNTFIWNSGDQGTEAAPAADTIKDFKIGTGGDVLDLRDLLHGAGVDSHDPATLNAYLHFSEPTAGQVKIEVDTNGAAPGGVTQTITLSGVTLNELHNLSGTSLTGDQDIIKKLLDHGNLKTDNPVT